jgi:hypothetical protein
MVKFKHPVIQWAHEHPLLFALFGTTIFFYAPARILGKTIRIAKYGDPTMGSASHSHSFSPEVQQHWTQHPGGSHDAKQYTHIHGLGDIPGVMSPEQRQLYTGTGNAGAVHFLGAVPSPEAGPITGGALFREVYDETAKEAEAGNIPKDQIQFHATAKYNQLIASGKYNIVVRTAPGPDQGKNPGDFYRDSRHTGKISWRSQINANPYQADKVLPNQVPVGKKYNEPSSSPAATHANPSVLNILGEGSVFAGLGLAQKLR